jgi:hypothetical protein
LILPTKKALKTKRLYPAHYGRKNPQKNQRKSHP